MPKEMNFNNILFCENGTCRVLVFLPVGRVAEDAEHNCPGCGQFGRTKGR